MTKDFKRDIDSSQAPYEGTSSSSRLVDCPSVVGNCDIGKIVGKSGQISVVGGAVKV